MAKKQPVLTLPPIPTTTTTPVNLPSGMINDLMVGYL
jgi:hypothetical protein